MLGPDHAWWHNMTPEQEAANEAEGVRRFKAGEKVMASSGAAEEPTYGYGRLSDYGYWEFPVPADMVEAARE